MCSACTCILLSKISCHTIYFFPLDAANLSSLKWKKLIRGEKWKKKLMLPSFVVLLQFAVVSVVIVLHPLLDLRVTHPVKILEILDLSKPMMNLDMLVSVQPHQQLKLTSSPPR